MKKTLQKVLSVIFSVLMIVSSVTMVSADSFVVGGEYFSYYETADGLFINGCSYDGADVVIPEEIGGVPVVGIGGWVFNYKESLVTLTIPKSVKYIQENAIVSCRNLREIIVNGENECFKTEGRALYTKDMKELVLYFGAGETSFTVPSSVKTVRSQAFGSSDTLENITLPQGLERIENGALRQCTKIKSVTIPDTVTFLGNFSLPRNIESLDIPDSVTVCEDNFSDYEYLETLNIGKNCRIKTLDGWAENYNGSEILVMCCKLRAINVHEENPYYSSENGVLYTKDMSALLRFPEGKEDMIFTMPESVTMVAFGAFRDVNNLENVVFSSNLKKIAELAFYDTEDLQSLDFPESLEVIERGAFEYCTGLSSVAIGKNTQVARNAFVFLTSLDAFNVSGENPYHTVIDGVIYNKDATELIAFPAGKNIEGFVFPETLRKLEYRQLSGVPELEATWEDADDFYIGDVLVRVETDATEYIIKEGTRLVGEMAMWANSGIYTLVVSEGVEILDKMSLCSMHNLGIVYLPKSLEYMGEDVFWADSSVHTIYYAGTEEEWNAIEKEKQWSLPDYLYIRYETSYEGNNVNPPEEDTYDYEYIDVSSGISVSTDTEAELSVENIMTEEIVASIDELLPKVEVESVFEINLQSEGEEIQPVDNVTVRIPTNNRFARVYRMEADGTLTDMNARYEDGYLVFTTDHFSYYALGQKDASLYELGDADMDEKITVRDATTVQKHLASLDVYQPDAVELLMDFDGVGGITVRDATAIQKAVAGLK